jgi:Mor family transcriptional regulator
MNDPLDQIAEDLEVIAVKFGVSVQIAADMASAMIERIKESVGGDDLYVPKPDKQKRNRLIKSRFNGVNHIEVCGEFNISKATLYRVLNGKD